MSISKKNWVKSYLLYLIICFISFTSFSNVVELQYTDPIKDKEFNHKNSTSITQDNTGFIWIGTNDGLYRYYGNKLTSYKSDPTDSTSITGNGVRKLFTDSEGRLWIITHLGLCTYNRCFDNFERVSMNSVIPDTAYMEISSVNQDNEKKIYFSGNGTIYKFHDNLKTFAPFLELDSIAISDFVFDDNNNLWISALNEGGLFFYNPKENKTERYLYNNKNENSLGFNTITDMVYEGNSRLWIGTYGGGVNLLDTKTGTFKRYKTADTYSNYVGYTYLDKQNNLWICDLNGLKWYDRDKDIFSDFEIFTSKEDNVKQNPAGIMQDQQGNYWTIYAPGGIGFWFEPKGIQFYNDDPFNFYHTINNNISKIVFDKNGALWIGNGNDGIDVFDWLNNKHKIFHSDPNNPYSLGKGAVNCIYKDHQDRMWIGTGLGGLQYYDEANDRFITYVNDPRNPNSISNNEVRDIVEDKDGNFWVSTHGKGINFFNTNEQKFYSYTSENSNLSNNWAFQLFIDSDENLWVGTAWGISRLKNGDTTFKSYKYDANDTNTITNTLINCLFEDSKKRLWIGTFDGLCRFNPQTDNFTRYRPEFASQNICAIEEGIDGNLWISNLNGISEFNPETGKVVRNLDELDGLTKGIFSNRASAKNNENVLFFGSNGGINYFNSEKLVFNNQIPEIYLTGFYLFNQKTTKFGDDDILPANISCISEIELEHNENSIGFDFSSTNYICVEKNRYKYKLEGVDIDWIETKDGKATYNYLPPGNYTFRVITSNNDGVWNNTGISIKVVINKPWWLSWWFISIIVSLMVFIIILIFKIRLATLQAEKAELEKQVQIRTKDLKDKNRLLEEQKEKLNKSNSLLTQQKNQIEQQSDKIKEDADNLIKINAELSKANSTKDKLFSIIAHDLINPFNAILGFSKELVDNYNEWDENQRIQFLNYINDSSNKAFDLMQNLLHWARCQNGMIEFNPESLKVSEIFDNVIDEVSTVALKKKININNLLEDKNLHVFFDKNMLSFILRNLLMNSIKFSNAEGNVCINAVEVESNKVQFSVKDFGVGMAPEYASSIFNIDKRIEINKGTSGEKGVGLGLSTCNEFITKNNGEIWVESLPGKGSTFFFTIQGKDNFRVN